MRNLHTLTIKIDLSADVFAGSDAALDAAITRALNRAREAFVDGAVGEYRYPLRDSGSNAIGYVALTNDSAEA